MPKKEGMSQAWRDQFQISDEWVKLAENTVGSTNELQVIGWLQEQGQLDAAAYIAWAAKQYFLPYLTPAFFATFAFQLPRLRELQAQHSQQFNEHCVPLYEWDGTLFVGAVAPLADNFLPIPYSVALAPAVELRQVWDLIMAPAFAEAPAGEPPQPVAPPIQPSVINAKDVAAAFAQAFASAPAGAPDEAAAKSSEPTVVIKKKRKRAPIVIPEEGLSLEESLVGIDLNAILNGEPSETEEFEEVVEPQPVEAVVSVQPEPIAEQMPVEMPPPPPVIIDEPIPTPPAVADVMAPIELLDTPSSAEAPASESVGLEMPEGLAMPAGLNLPEDMPPVPTERSESAEAVTKAGELSSKQLAAAHAAAANGNDPSDAILEKWLKKFDLGMILTKQGEQLHPYKWMGPWLLQSGPIPPIDLSKPSIFKIVSTSHLPYHGYVVTNDTNGQFFDYWCGSQVPPHITIVPLMLHDQIVGMLLGTSTVDPQPADTLPYANGLSTAFTTLLEQKTQDQAA